MVEFQKVMHAKNAHGLYCNLDAELYTTQCRGKGK